MFSIQETVPIFPIETPALTYQYHGSKPEMYIDLKNLPGSFRNQPHVPQKKEAMQPRAYE